LLTFIIAGLVIGSAYALAGVGLVLTYKTSGVFNFAHGALATVSAYLFYFLNVEHGWPWIPAAAVCLLVAAPLLALLLELMARRLDGAGLAIRVVSTIGVLLVIQGIAVIIFGASQTRTVPEFLPDHAFHIGSTTVTMSQLIVMAVGLVATAGLYLYFRRARMGVAMRAVVDDPALLAVSGTSPVRVRRLAWIIGVVFASASGLLLVPLITLNATTLTFLVVAAFGAAALGQFRNLPGTYVGGLAIGIGSSLATKWFTHGLLSGLSATLPFLVLFVVLLVSPRRRLVDAAPVLPRSAPAWQSPWPAQAAIALPLLVVLVFVPSFAGFHLADWSGFLGLAVVFMSLGLLVRTSGQVSLCHVSFMAIGACAFSQLTVAHGWPWIPALAVAGLIAVPIGALLAIPAIRLSGLYLALATFGFGILLQYMFYSQNYMFGDLGLGAVVPMPHFESIGLATSDRNYYYLCLLLAVIVAVLVVAIGHGRLGRLLRALADSPTGLAASGASTHLTRLLVFCLSAFLAAIGGVMAAGAIGTATDLSYQPLTSLTYFALIIISIGRAPWYALLAAVGSTIIPSYWSNANATNWLQVLFGLSAVAFAVMPQNQDRVPASIRRMLDRTFRRHPAGRAARLASPDPAPAQVKVASNSLALSDIRVAFGGLIAVDGVDLEARTGTITGLIGPNGAGKTTTFNVGSGFLRPTRGRVRVGGADVTRQSVARRARGGLGRTFQQMQLFDSLSVRENVALGYEAAFAGGNIFGHLAGTRRTAAHTAEATQRALEMCGLQELAERTPGSLSTGQRRRVELARCLAGRFQILLLDEPSAGLDRAETEQFGDILKKVVAERGVGILLVEHDMALVTKVCDYIHVLDFGKPIYRGAPAEVMASPAVRSAYLGDDSGTAPKESALGDAEAEIA
jgi:ABC-type branched-subunit amino acid transport system ATPase component/branched-subunit amino acid ABC-type transport system permease component